MDGSLFDGARREQLRAQLGAAEASVGQALTRLRCATALALTGAHYDAAQFDQIVLDLRAAQSRVAAARLAWAHCRRDQPRQDGHPAGAPPAPPPSPARLGFARWLYEHGYISG
jgi:hypothetical protein